MYEQIIEILKSNYLPFENIFYQDQFGSWNFNDNEDFDEYILEQTKDEQAFLWLRQGLKEHKFTIINGLKLNNIIVYILKEETNNE